jgi:hypothetical protein
MKKFPFRLIVFLLVMAGFMGKYENIQAGEWKTISAQTLKKKMEDGDRLSLINVLPKIVYNAGHIEGSINIPIGKLETSPDWPKEKNKPLIFYCMGVA